MLLGGEHILKLTAHPGVYVRHPFLRPMQEAALTVHKQLEGLKAECEGCRRGAYTRAAFYLANAFTALVTHEAHNTPNDLARLKETMQLLLQTKEDFVIQYQTPDEKDHELKL